MSYNGIAGVYDEYTKNVRYDLRADFVRSLLLRCGISGGIMLDLACGTGSLSQRLAGYGYSMLLVDSSPEMLEAAKVKLPDATVVCQDMTKLDLYGTVDCCVCSLDSVNHLTRESDVKKAFSRVSLFLNDAGAFIFDVNTVYKHRQTLARRTFAFESENSFLVWQNSPCGARNIVDITLDIFLKGGDGRYERRRESFSERAYELGDLKLWLEQSGFEDVETFGDLSLSPPRDDEERVYFSCKKRGKN